MASLAFSSCDVGDEDNHHAAPSAPPSPSTAAEAGSKERARQREIASYLCAASIPPGLEGVRREVSQDPNLTALVQLGALRLDTDRAFLSLLDGRSQYIVAEATRYHSITRADETMFIGLSKLDISFGVCPRTIEFFNDDSGTMSVCSQNIIADRSRYIINDFRADAHYSTRPYVTGFPYMVSYAEVPLVSPLGYVLGSYCVVDDKLRDFDNDATISVLDEVAATIMTHLDLVRLKQNRARAENLIKGLSEFIQHESGAPLSSTGSLSDSMSMAARNPAADVALSGSEQLDAEDDVAGKAEPPLDRILTSLESSSSVSSGADSNPTNSVETDGIDTPPSTPPRQTNTPTSESDPQAEVGEVESPLESTISASIRATFVRAARLIREAMSMDGLLFLDACPSGFNGLRNAPAPHENPDSPESETEDESLRPGESTSRCEVIASSVNAPSETESQRNPGNALPEAVLQRFIRKYPRGHVFSADEFGPIDDHFRPGASYKRPSRPRRRSSQLNCDVRLLFSFLPGARYIIFLPIWHFQRDTWFGATLGWVKDATQAIDVDDLNLISAFGNSIMAEVSRLEALAVSRAKSDFISSVSHELRSPLHGILASGELLREEVEDPLLVSTLDMIESCGRTLLDTFNNLLDYAKISRLAQTNKSTDSDIGDSSRLKARSLTCPYDMSQLVQEVVDGIYLGFIKTDIQMAAISSNSYATTAESGHHSSNDLDEPVLVTVNVETRASWIMDLDVGSWKRIVMNLFGNALKFTRKGRIQIGLKVVQRTFSSGHPESYVCFSVKDTGIGMGPEYVRYQLFEPFVQENNLSQGTGLGLSIVQQLVKNLQGTLEIKSRAGIGTSIKVLIPLGSGLGLSPAPQTLLPTESQLSDTTTGLAGRSLCYISPEAYNAVFKSGLFIATEARGRSIAIRKALAYISSNVPGMKLVEVMADEIPSADVYLIDDHDFSKFLGGQENELPHEKLVQVTPLVVLCNPRVGPSPVFKSKISKGNVFLFRDPVGPKKLVSVLTEILSSSGPLPAAFLEESPQTLTEVIETAQVATSPLPLTPPLDETQKPDGISGLPPEKPPSCIADTNETDQPAISPMTGSTTAPQIPTKPAQNLLLVDDNSINLKILSTVVKKLNCSYLTAINGLEAVETFKSSATRFDVIFMDIQMPIMDGFTAIREIRAYERELKLTPSKIVALTGLGSDSEKEAFASGTNLLLTKPVRLKQIRELLS